MFFLCLLFWFYFVYLGKIVGIFYILVFVVCVWEGFGIGFVRFFGFFRGVVGCVLVLVFFRR